MRLTVNSYNEHMMLLKLFYYPPMIPFFGNGVYTIERELMLDLLFNCGRLIRGTLQKGQNRVLRGGCWINNGRNLRSANRNANEPDNRNHNMGFRLAGALLAGGSINQRRYPFQFYSIAGQIQDSRCVSQLFAQSLPLSRFF